MEEKKWNILLVEDSPTQALRTIEGFKQLGVTVSHVKNGEEALKAIGNTQFDCVISDINMPKMDGFALCKNLRDNEHTSRVPIILFTSLYSSEDVLLAIQNGANFFVSKPSTPDKLLKYVKDFYLSTDKEGAHTEINFLHNGHEEKIQADLNKVISLLLSTYDQAVEQRKALEKAQHALKDNNITLKMLNEQKNTFLGMAAHDLRNPLSVIKGFCELLEETLPGKISEEEMDMIQTIHHSSETILTLVNELLDVSVIESGNLELDFKEENLVSLFERTYKMNKGIAEKKEIEMVLNIEGKIPPIECDPKKIEEVLVNFITNAIKYSEPKTHVTITLKAENENVVFSISDEGQGIPKEEQENLFKTFSKTTTKTTAGESSTGLGLAIVKKIIKAHGGEFGCESEPGKGSTFFAKIPIKQNKQAA